MRSGKGMAALGRMERAGLITVESGSLTFDYEVMHSEAADSNERTGRVLRSALRLTNASVALDVPGRVMARLMRLRADGTSDGNAVVLKRLLRALEDAASRMPAAPATMGALPEATAGARSPAASSKPRRRSPAKRTSA